MPSWPIEMPSDTEMVPNSSGYPPAACTPSFTALASRSSGRLQGVISFQLLATPIWGLAKSSSPMPTARSMPRAAARSRPSVTSRLRGLMSGVEVFAVVMRRTLRPVHELGWGSHTVDVGAGSATRHRGQHVYDGAVGEGGADAVQRPHVLTVHEQVDVPAQNAGVLTQP